MKEENGALVTEGEEIVKQFGKVFKELRTKCNAEN